MEPLSLNLQEMSVCIPWPTHRYSQQKCSDATGLIAKTQSCGPLVGRSKELTALLPQPSVVASVHLPWGPTGHLFSVHSPYRQHELLSQARAFLQRCSSSLETGPSSWSSKIFSLLSPSALLSVHMLSRQQAPSQGLPLAQRDFGHRGTPYPEIWAI